MTIFSDDLVVLGDVYCHIGDVQGRQFPVGVVGEESCIQ